MLHLPTLDIQTTGLPTIDKNAERRRHSRLPTRQSAELFLGAAQAHHVCMVLDRSSSGVQIDLGEPLDLPETMIIQFSSEASQLVRRCWAAGTRAGMEFIGTSNPAADDGSNHRAFKNPRRDPCSPTAIAAQVTAALQQIESLVRDFLNLGPEEAAVFFSEIGSRPGGPHRRKVTIIAPQAETAARHIETAINQTTPHPVARRMG